MGFYDAIRIGASAAADSAYAVDRSLRFNSGDNTYLARTPSSTTSRTTWTYSTWIKKTNFGSTVGLFGTQGSDNNTHTELIFTSANKFSWQAYSKVYIQTNQVFRDPSAWFHLLVRCDTTNSTQADRIQLWINGSRVTSFATENLTGSGTEFGINRNVDHRIGERPAGSDNFNGYLAEMHFVDGTALDSSSFTETNAITGQLIPKKYDGSYGTNGFYLNFSDNSGTTATTLGKDSSGNGNNFTPNNFSVAAGAGNDSLEDTPTNNFPTFNNLVKSANTFTEGNLQVTMTSSTPSTFYSTMGVSSGKYYMEFLVKSNNNYPLGISSTTRQADYFSDSTSDQIGFWLQNTNTRVFRNGSNITANSEVVGNFETGVEGTSTTWAVDDIAGLALDMDNKIIYLYKGATQVGYVNFSTFNYDTVFFGGGNYVSGNVYVANFGQRAFAHTPPTGYKALNSANLPDPTIKLPNKHFDTVIYSGDGNSTRSITGVEFQPDWVWLKIRSASYHHKLYDAVRGAGSLKALVSSTNGAEGSDLDNSTYGFVNSFDANGFSVTKGSASTSFTNGGSATYVAWNWNAGDTDGKTYTVTVVSDSGNKYRFDGFGTSAVTLDLAEGGTYIFDQSDSSNATHPLRFYTAADKTGGEYTTGVTTSGTAGSSGATVTITIAASAPTLYYQCSSHAGMGGQINTNSTLGSSNFDGTIQNTVKANTTAGFSIVTYTGNGSDGATIGHGLGVKPDFIVIKKRANNSGGNTGNWIAQHKFLTNGVNATSTLFTLTSYSSSAIYLNVTNGQSSYGFDNQVNGNTDTFIAYCFSEVAGYSKFGSYTGNGNASGTFVFTGFRPAFIIFKNTVSGHNWEIYDTTREPHNIALRPLYANQAYAEESNATLPALDILSNGFKPRSTWNEFNQNGSSIIYLAFAEAPFKNARAR